MESCSLVSIAQNRVKPSIDLVKILPFTYSWYDLGVYVSEGQIYFSYTRTQFVIQIMHYFTSDVLLLEILIFFISELYFPVSL